MAEMPVRHRRANYGTTNNLMQALAANEKQPSAIAKRPKSFLSWPAAEAQRGSFADPTKIKAVK